MLEVRKNAWLVCSILSFFLGESEENRNNSRSVYFEKVFVVIDFLQKTNEQIRLYYYDTSGRLVFVRFLEEINDPKKPFRN